jgi:hypothetical protein
MMKWIGILILCGAYFAGEDNNSGTYAIYCNPPYGVSVPFIQNTMLSKAFKFMRTYIHFSRTTDQKKKGNLSITLF